jgi:hypothetical protein
MFTHATLLKGLCGQWRGATEVSRRSCLLAAIIWAATHLAPAPLLAAAPLDFDCDVPADHFSSVSQDGHDPITIKGTITAIQMRSGNNLPVAGIRIASLDGLNSTGFRLIASSTRAKTMVVKLNTIQGKNFKESTQKDVDAKAAVPFVFSLSESGEVTLTINAVSFKTSFIPIANSKVMAFCSTGQFKFTGLIFPNASQTVRTAAP